MADAVEISGSGVGKKKKKKLGLKLPNSKQPNIFVFSKALSKPNLSNKKIPITNIPLRKLGMTF